MISEQDIQKLFKLSRLSTEQEDLEMYKSHLSNMLDHMEELKALDLKDVEPLTTLDESPSRLREDEVGVSLEKDLSFKNTAHRDLDHFSIPKVIG